MDGTKIKMFLPLQHGDPQYQVKQKFTFFQNSYKFNIL